MITITHQKGCITIKGHAGYAPHGQDIVCAAVSTLLQVLVLSLNDLTDDEIIADLRPGESIIEYNQLSEAGKLLIESFLLGVGAISEAYPDNVSVEKPPKLW